jgi:DNA-binding response OmpR family regulator
MKILIIEDEQKIANALKQGLEQEGFAIDTAYTGTAGYDFASTENYDLIILDLMLPEISGTDICKNLRKDNNSTPIIMLTAKSEAEDKINGLNMGADDYLAKPFAFAELLARIRALLRRPRNMLEQELTCGDLKIKPQDFEVLRSETPITLSRKEFSLLEYLVRNKNKTLPKDKIIEHVWNYDDNILPNTVEVYIGYLRNKIDRPFKNLKPLIKTIRGFGYRIEEPSA